MLPLYPTSLEVAKVSRARTQKIRRFSGKTFNHHYQQEMEFEETYYGVLVMVLCDENQEVIGDKGYRGCEFVKVCESKEDKSIRQAVEGVNSQIKAFNYVSRWRKGITLLAYLYGYAIGYSFFRKSYVLG